MPYVPRELKTESFIAGFENVYTLLGDNPELRMIPISELESVRGSLKQLGYRFRVVYRGPHRRHRSTLKSDAWAFNVYFEE
jgi:hypothetical protein